MLRHLCALALLCSGSLVFAEDTPLFSIDMPDAQRTVERFQKSLYGQALAVDAAAECRGMAEMALSQMAGMFGVASFSDGLAALQGMEVAMVPQADGGDPKLTIQIRGADLHGPVLGAFTRGREGEALAAPEGLEQAVQVRRRQFYGVGGDRLILANEESALRSLPISSSDEDITLSWYGPSLATLMDRELDWNMGPLASVLVPSGSVSYSLVAGGLRATSRIPSYKPAVGTITRADLTWVPADSNSIFAINVKPGEWIRRKAKEMTDIIRAEGMQDRYPTLPQVLAMADQNLAGAGFPVSSGDLLDGLEGTVVVAFGSGNGLIPTLSLALPRSTAIDLSLEWALQRAGHGPVADGELAFLTLRGMPEMPPTLVTGVGVLRTESQWIVSSDPVMLSDLQAGDFDSWSATAEANALLAEKPFLLAWGDARKSLSPLVPLAGIGASQVMGGMLADDAVAVAHALASKAGPATALGTVADGDLVISAEGPLGGLLAGGGLGGGSAPIMAGLLLPAITSAREKARTVESKNNMKQLATMCYAYEQDHGTFPPDLATLVREMGMSPKIMQSPLAPGNSNSYLYVRSSSGASSMQPVILEDPANYGWEKLVVIFADTHAETITDPATIDAWWAKAQELAAKHGTTGTATWDEWKATVEARR